MAVTRQPLRRVAQVCTLPTVPDDVAKEFLSLYRAAFAPLERLAPARQALTDDEFLAEMRDGGVLKFICTDRDGSTVAMAVVATDLSAVPWISPAYFEERFPEHYGRGAIYYFSALLVRPDRQGGPWAGVLLKEVARRLIADRAIAAFDCCEHTATVMGLPQLFEDAISSRLGPIDAIELDPQRYYAYLLPGAR